MVILILKTFAALTIMFVLHGCNNIIISPAGGFSMLDNSYINNAGEWISKATRDDYATGQEKQASPGFLAVFEKNKNSIQNDALLNNDSEISNNLLKFPEALAEINKAGRMNTAKVQDWIVCKSQFVRVHSEGQTGHGQLTQILF